MVATNVAARGLDIPEVDLVVQSSPPKVSVLYYGFILLVFWVLKQMGGCIVYFHVVSHSYLLSARMLRVILKTNLF